VPDPFALAILLTAVAALAGLGQTGDPEAVVHAWVHGTGVNRGLWGLLAFAMQMCLILVTGYALASSPAVSRVVDRLAAVPRTTATAAAMVSFVAMVSGLINWGLGLVVGALLARAVGPARTGCGRSGP
jgi:short-chain fatty acids transporter